MTPAEIMGVSPDQILQAQEHKANSDQSGLTAIERILQGRNPARNLQAVAAGNVSASALQNFRSDANNGPNGVMANLINGSLRDLQTAAYGSSMDAAANENLFAEPNENSDWSKLFGVPRRSPTPDAAQQLQQEEEMKQFIQLLNPGSVAASATPASSDEADVTAPATTATAFSDFNSTTPVANPLGNPFAPLAGNTALTGGIGKPASYAPLPAITRQPDNQSAVRPAWAPQPPPWLSTTPQPFTIPRRNF